MQPGLMGFLYDNPGIKNKGCLFELQASGDIHKLNLSNFKYAKKPAFSCILFPKILGWP